jgi:putative transposase
VFVLGILVHDRRRIHNGVPFASPTALCCLSRLSVWWLRLGIRIERTEPGHPQQDGRHQRMHLTLKKEATKPAAANTRQQQARFDAFVEGVPPGGRAYIPLYTNNFVL